jgi:hypothetical protein
MEERVFFDRDGVRVTNARFMVGSQTYAMNGVTSVKSRVTPPNRTGAIIAVIVGVLLFFGLDGGAKLFGLLVAGVAGWMLSQMKNTHAVFLSSASGEVQALANQDGEYIGGVIAALNDALVHRG